MLRRKTRLVAARATAERLELRTLLDATLGADGVLTVTGTENPELITVTAAAGQVNVAVGAAAHGPFPAASVLAVNVDALGGADTITLVNIAVPSTLLGGAGADVINGGNAGDFSVGGTGADQFNGGAGNDTFVWNPGDGNDVINGDADTDTHIFNGSNGDEIMAAAPGAVPGRVTFTRNLGNIVMDIGGFENLLVNALGGADLVSGTGNLAPLINLTFDGGAGNDTLNGGNGVDLFLAGEGDDVVDGNQGNDIAFLGAGNDTFIWDPGDGSDFVEGEGGFDTLLFNGSAGNENFTALAAGIGGQRLLFTRNLGNIAMDVGTTEKLDVRALGGNDNTIIFDLSSTPVTEVVVDGGAGDDTFAGSALLAETFLGGDDNDVATFGAGDRFEMGAGVDALLVLGTGGAGGAGGRDNIHVDARGANGSTGDEEIRVRNRGPGKSAVFNDGEIVTVITLGGDDKVKVHKRAEELWDVLVV